jgi:tRNA-dihydrouridine synthase
MRGDGYIPSVEEKLKVAGEHARKFEEVFEGKVFFPMRKHLVGYANNFPLAGDLRRKLVMTNSAEEVDIACKEFLENEITL